MTNFERDKQPHERTNAVAAARDAVIGAIRPYRDGVGGVAQALAHEAALDTFETAIERERRLSYDAAVAAVAFGEAHPDDDELDLSSYTQGYRDALGAPRVAALEAALDEAANHMEAYGRGVELPGFWEAIPRYRALAPQERTTHAGT